MFIHLCRHIFSSSHFSLPEYRELGTRVNSRRKSEMKWKRIISNKTVGWFFILRIALIVLWWDFFKVIVLAFGDEDRHWMTLFVLVRCNYLPFIQWCWLTISFVDKTYYFFLAKTTSAENSFTFKRDLMNWICEMLQYLNRLCFKFYFEFKSLQCNSIDSERSSLSPNLWTIITFKWHYEKKREYE